jgi:hypothetical protein
MINLRMRIWIKNKTLLGAALDEFVPFTKTFATWVHELTTPPEEFTT